MYDDHLPVYVTAMVWLGLVGMMSERSMNKSLKSYKTRRASPEYLMAQIVLE
jgi:hypothetical protein